MKCINCFGITWMIFALITSSFASFNDSVATSVQWSGGPNCSLTPCPTGYTRMDSYACNPTPTDQLSQSFMDPVPPGSIATDVNMTFWGRFDCSTRGGNPTFATTINDIVILFGRFYSSRLGCNCTAQVDCMQPTAQYSSGIITDNLATGYHYGATNTLLVSAINSIICLAKADISVGYIDATPTIIGVAPLSGTTSTITTVTITAMAFLNNTNYSWKCKFGNISIVPATAIGNDTLQCDTPLVAQPGQVEISVGLNGAYYYPTNFTFTFVAPGSSSGSNTIQEIKSYWYFIAIAAVLVLGIVALCIFAFFKRRKNRRDPSLMPLLGSDPESQIGLADINLAERIGKGNFGEVYKGYWHGTVVAVKKTKLPQTATKEELAQFIDDFEREALIMKSLRHPNILQFLGICRVGEGLEICIITEFMNRGSLYRILHLKELELPWELKLRMAIDISRGMNYLHLSTPMIIHRDLKSHNLLLDDNWRVKIADFGLAKLLHADGSHGEMTSCGTPAWTAPEVLRNERYTESVDVYSFGILCWELVTRDEPHKNTPPFQVVFAVGTQGIRPALPSSCPTEFGALLQECWSENPKERPPFSEIMTRLEKLLAIEVQKEGTSKKRSSKMH
eukprot:TRINITY_DN3318_c0_g1_i1.p1 TRINITY_DN3318_c0_g1~~TRINITY_DN3318_c0_g1_i1.p1  ORF type:complete len:621 (+),score=139.58 TRINITY_DN3318_c0_g1_i1:106-1968(+)